MPLILGNREADRFEYGLRRLPLDNPTTPPPLPTISAIVGFANTLRGRGRHRARLLAWCVGALEKLDADAETIEPVRIEAERAARSP